MCGDDATPLLSRNSTVKQHNVGVQQTALLFCTMTNKGTIISQIITLLHVSTLLYLPQGFRSQYHVKLHKYVSCSCWLHLI
jgi:hypothetical protein